MTRGRPGDRPTTRTRPRRPIRDGLEGNLCRCTGYHNIVARPCSTAIGGGRRRLTPGAVPRPTWIDSRNPIGQRHRVKRTRKTSAFSPAHGQYTDDVDAAPPDLCAISCARRMRTPTSGRSDSTPRKADARRARRSSPADDMAGRKIGGLPCGWMINIEGRLADEGGAASGCWRRARCAMSAITSPWSIAETAGAGARTRPKPIEVDYEELAAVVDTRRARRSRARRHARRCRPDNSGLRLASRRQGRDRRAPSPRPRTSPSSTSSNNRLIPNAMEPRAAIGDYDARRRAATRCTPPARTRMSRGCVLSAFVGSAARAQAARDRARMSAAASARRSSSMPKRRVCVWAAKKVGRPVKWTAERTEAFLVRCAWPRPRHPCRAGDWTRTARFLGLRVKTPAPISAPICRPSRPAVPTYPLRHAAVGPVQHSGDLCRGRGGLHQHRAGRRLSRRRPAGGDLSWSSASSRRRRANWSMDPAELRRKNFITPASRTRRRCIMRYDTGDYDALARQGAGDRRRRRLRQRASAKPPKRGKLRGIGYSAYIEACGIAPSAAVGSLGAGVGLWESAEVRVQPDRHGRRS